MKCIRLLRTDIEARANSFVGQRLGRSTRRHPCRKSVSLRRSSACRGRLIQLQVHRSCHFPGGIVMREFMERTTLSPLWAWQCPPDRHLQHNGTTRRSPRLHIKHDAPKLWRKVGGREDESASRGVKTPEIRKFHHGRSHVY